jgi:hypothetical protein
MQKLVVVVLLKLLVNSEVQILLNGDLNFTPGLALLKWQVEKIALKELRLFTSI